MFKQKENSYVNRAKKLKRVKTDTGTKIVGATEEEIQEIKTGLDTNIINDRAKRKSEKELRRLGFLN